MKITSTAFQEGSTIPTKYTYHGVEGGKNISLPFSWSGVPAGTKSFALSIVDPHPVAKHWVHWFVIDIPASAEGLSEGASADGMPEGGRELENTYRTMGYGGPEPPKGSGAHPYVVTLYALNTQSLTMPDAVSLQDFNAAIGGKVLATAVMTGYFER